MLPKNSLLKEDRLKSIDIVKVRLVKDGTMQYRANPLKDSKRSASVIREFLGNEDREVFITLNLDSRNRINSIHVVGVGNAAAVTVHAREIFKTAILSNASRIILGHNHPSGDPEPSPDDLKITCELFKCGDLLGIEVLDHIIVGDGKFVNFMKFKDGKITWFSNNFEDHREVS